MGYWITFRKCMLKTEQSVPFRLKHDSIAEGYLLGIMDYPEPSKRCELYKKCAETALYSYYFLKENNLEFLKKSNEIK